MPSAPAASATSLPGSDSVLELPRMVRDPRRFLEERTRRYGHVWRTRWVRPLVFMMGPAANRLIHVTEREKFSSERAHARTAFGRIFAGSILVSDDPQHQRDRAILQPAMSRLGLAASFSKVLGAWQRAAHRLESEPVVDLYPFTLDVTFEVAASALIGLEPGEDLSWYRPRFQALVDGAMARFPSRFPLGQLDRGLRARDELVERLTPRIEAARDRPPEGMLGLLAHHRDEQGQPLSSRRVAEHLLLLFWAGYDTTASTAAWVLHRLAFSPYWQERLAREQDAVLGERSPTPESLESLAEAGWFLREIERCFPAVLFMPRRTLADVELEGKVIPKDTLVFYSPYMSHRLAEVFPEPDRFLPERWNPALGARTAPATALVTFGGGPRICLGKAFALLQLRTLLHVVLSRFRVAFEEGQTGWVKSLPMCRPEGARIRFSLRERRSGSNAAAPDEDAPGRADAGWARAG